MENIEYVKVTHKYPLCPHCEKEITKIEYIEQGVIRTTVLFICPHCNKIISISITH